jgi:hypothetical protein
MLHFFHCLLISTLLLFCSCFSLSFSVLSAEETRSVADKSDYTLFNPTPVEQMREYQPDRPDVTEGPQTVDAGHFAVETAIFNYTCNHIGTPDPDRPQQLIVVGETNFRVGVLNNMELQLVFQPFAWQKFKTGIAMHEEQYGFGDTRIRAKINMWGNDEGETAMALLPWIGLPTNQVGEGNDKFTGGLIVPFALEAPHDFAIGMMTEFDAINNTSGEGHHLEWTNSITVSHRLFIEKLQGYLEFASNNSFDTGSPWVATADVGFLYKVNENLFVDIGTNLGLTPDADHLSSFIGFARRF